MKKNEIEKVLDQSIGQVILGKENDISSIIKDKFLKATTLLQANKITGAEYVDYCSLRLGIPFPQNIRAKLIATFKVSDIVIKNSENKSYLLDKDSQQKILSNQRVVLNGINLVLARRAEIGKKIWSISGGAAGGATTLGIFSSGATTASLVAMGPLGWAILGGITGLGILSGYGLGRLVALIRKHFIMKKGKVTDRIEGWERVEALIERIDQQRLDIVTKEEAKNKVIKSTLDDEKRSLIDIDRKKFSNYETSLKDLEAEKKKIALAKEKEESETPLTKDEIDAQLHTLEKELRRLVKEKGINESRDIENINFSDELLQENVILKEELEKVIFEDSEVQASILEERVKETNVPIRKFSYDDKSALIVPEFGARQKLAYGTVEYERKDIKDRRYNLPLIMTIKFKERLSSDSFSDNELTAVIGILGVISRIPSDEMKYILKSNAEGITLKGALQGISSIKDALGDLLSTAKIKKNIENLPQSLDVWKNLEKISQLALANKIAGKASNNIANAHLIFSQKEIDEVRNEFGFDYIKDKQLVFKLMKRYSAFTVMIANDPGERVYIFDDLDNTDWNLVPYSALKGKDTGDQLSSALMKISRGY